MRRSRASLLGAACAVVLVVASIGSATADGDGVPDGMAPDDFFLRRIRPVLAERCWRCHGPQRQRANLRLDSREAVLRGGRVRDVVPGHPETSRLIDAVGYEDADLQMPPDGPLGEGEVADLGAWVRMGVPWAEPRDPALAAETRPEPARRPSWTVLAGRFHPLVVHFPIALILAAALGECAALLAARRARPARAAGFVTAGRHALSLGSAGAAAAAALGWVAAAQARFTGEPASYLELHRWLGTAVAVAAVALRLWAGRVDRGDPAPSRTAYRVALLGCALLVGLVGHLGGSLTHGIGWLGLP